MAALTPPVCDFGAPAPNFALPATDGKTYRRDDLAGDKGLLIMFICNHCPFVIAVLDKIVRDGRDLQALGIGVAAICSNDPRQYPEDDFGPMTALAKARGFTFPYLHDVDQSVARAYSAVCTPDFFGYDAGLELQYRGRIDASRGTVVGDLPRELYEAMAQVAETGKGPQEQTPSIGCSIKWASA